MTDYQKPNPIMQYVRIFTHGESGNKLAVLDTLDLSTLTFSASTAHLITRINVPRDCRGHGFGRQLLQQACDAADKAGVDLLAEPMPYADSPLGIEALTEWYRRYGFVEFGGIMRRRPIVKRRHDRPTLPLRR